MKNQLQQLILKASITALGLLFASSYTYAVPCTASVLAVAGQLGATCDGGLAPTTIFGTVIGGNEGTGVQTTPLDGAPDYSYVVPSPIAPIAGDTTDFHWVHETSGAFAGPSAGTMWSFGGFGTDFILYPSIDHGPVPLESLETTLYGSADGGASWTPGRIITLYEQGFSAISIDDDVAQRWRFSSAVNMISATAGLQQGAYTFASADTEIDAIGMVAVPEPASALLMVLGLTALGIGRRKL